MNVLYFTQLFYPFLFGGGEYIFFLIARELAKRGHEVHVITQRMQGTPAYEIYEGIKIYRVGSEFVYSGTLPPTIKYNLDYLINAFKEGRRIIIENRKKREDIDIIHSNTYVPALSGHICSKIYRIPHVITFHDVYQATSNKFWEDWISKQNENLPFYASTLSKIIEKIILKLNVSAFHTVSEMSREDLVKFGVSRTNVSVIPNGVDQMQYQYATDNSNGLNNKTSPDPMAVFVGRLVFYKNVETVIRAFKSVVKVLPTARLVIVGDGPHKESLVHESESIKGNVIFAGRISHDEKIKIISESSFMVFPSLIEGFGIATIEGFACGKPVIVSDVRPPSDIVKDDYCGYVISPFDIDAWAEKMIQLFNDKEKQEELGRNAYKEFLSKYEIKTVVSNIESLYKRIAKARLG